MSSHVLDPRRGEYPVAGRIYKMSTVDLEFPWCSHIDYVWLKGIDPDPNDSCHGHLTFIQLSRDREDRSYRGLMSAGIYRDRWFRLFQEVPAVLIKGPGRFI